MRGDGAVYEKYERARTVILLQKKKSVRKRRASSFPVRVGEVVAAERRITVITFQIPFFIPKLSVRIIECE